jgi:hypothetical protein
MRASLSAMNTALRVLTAINERRQPDQSDIDALSVFAGPRPEGTSLDVFVCDVIRKALNDRAKARGESV